MQKILEIIKKAREEKGWSQTDVATKLGLGLRQYQNIEAGTFPKYKRHQIEDLEKILGIKVYESIYAENVPRGTNGELQLVHRDVKVLGKEKSFQQKLHERKLTEQWDGVPMFDAPISASFTETYRDEKIYKPRFYLLDDRFRDCDFGSVIRGDSMHSEIRHGDFVVCKEVTDPGFVIFGEIYYIISTNELETCKYLHPGKQESEFLLKAYNKSVPDTPLPKKYLRKLYKVRGILRAY